MNVCPTAVPAHRGNHRQLIAQIPTAEVSPAPVDAIIVPTSRPAYFLRDAMLLAKGLGCGVVVLCGDFAKASEAAELGSDLHVSVVAVDVTEDMRDLPDAHTAEVMARTPFPYPCDTSTKRNLGLLLSHVAGWERVFLLDDDVAEVAPPDVRAAAGLLGCHAAVGMQNCGSSDNSVVCHANRMLGGVQEQFIGAGAMAVTLRRPSYFPCIYNDDWFYLLGTGEPFRYAVTGSMKHMDHDPFVEAASARSEEFGDCLAEGLLKLAGDKQSLEHANSAYWDEFLSGRCAFIEGLLERLRGSRLNSNDQNRIEKALTFAREACEEISSQLCAEYVQAWRSDLHTWRRFLCELPVKGSLEEALGYLNWSTEEAKWPWPADGMPARLFEDRLIFWDGLECAWFDDEDARSTCSGALSPPVTQAFTVQEEVNT